MSPSWIVTNLLWQAAGWTMLHFLWIGGLVAALAAIVERAVRRSSPELRYAMAVTQFFGLALIPCCLFAWRVSLPLETTPSASALTQVEIASADLQVSAAPRDGGASSNAASGDRGGTDSAEINEKRDWTDDDRSASTGRLPVNDGLVPQNLRSESTIAFIVNFGGTLTLWLTNILPWIWVIGFPLTCCTLLIGISGAERFRRRCRILDENHPAVAMCRRLEQVLNLRKRILIGLADGISAPILVGVIRPLILFPASTLSGFSTEQFEMILLHELAHVRRWDNLINLMQRVIEAVLFFHPAIWWLSNRIRLEREHCCDATVLAHIRAPEDYAEMLVQIAFSKSRSDWAMGSSISHQLIPRVRRILKQEEDRMLVSRKTIVASFSVLLTLAIVTVVNAQRRSDKAQEKPTAIAQGAKVEPAPEKATANAEEGIPILTIQGTVLMPDGTVAKDAVLEQGREWRFNDVVRMAMTEGRFEIKTTGKDNAAFLIRTPDWNLQAALQIGGEYLRKETLAPRTITLSPTKTVKVKVTDAGRAAADCQVRVEAGSYRYPAKSRADGVAEVRIPRDQSVFLITAWSDEHKIGGLHAGRQRGGEASGDEFSIEISRGKPIRARVVDAKKNPLANVPLKFVAVDGNHGEFFVEGGPDSKQNTDAHGEAKFDWVPDWADGRFHVSVRENGAWRLAKREDKEILPDGTHQLTVAPSRANERVTVTGHLTGVTGDVTGVLVEFWSFAGEEQGTSDVRYARCNAQGEFTTRVLPGSEYRVFVDDHEVVSDFWNGVIALTRESIIRPPVLNRVEGVPVEIQITYGNARRPMQAAWIHFESKDTKNKRHSGGRRFWGRTDEKGRCEVFVMPGELEIRASKGDWEVTKTIEVIEGQRAVLDLHREVADRQPIAGKLVLPSGVSAELSNTSISMAGMDGESTDEVTVTADANGNFSTAIAAKTVSVFAMSRGEKFFGRGIVEVRPEGIEISMHPTIRFEGRIVGDDAKPLPGVKVRMLARLNDDDAHYPPGTPRYQKRFVDLYRDRYVVTDENGNFVYPTAPQLMELFFGFTLPGEKEESPGSGREAYFQPGLTYPVETFRLSSQKKPQPDGNQPLDARALEEMLKTTIRDCRIAGLRTLVIISGPGDIPAPFIKTYITEKEDPKDIYHYLPRIINGPEAAAMPSARPVFEARNWPFPDKNSIFLAAIDGDGKESGRLTLKLQDDRAAARFAANFLKDHRPAARDARADHATALAEAKRTNRRVWVRTMGSRCAPCFGFSRWLDSNRELLAKDYVVFGFDPFLDENGAALSKELDLHRQGIPCHAIFDPDGRRLIDSSGPDGNIGDPSGDAKAIDHVRKMLKTSAVNLTDAEIDKLVLSISGAHDGVSEKRDAAPAAGTEEQGADAIEKNASAKPITISGVCVDETGEPLADVKVVLYRRVRETVERVEPIREIRTGQQGGYRFADVAVPPPRDQAHFMFVVVLTASGRASQFAYVELLNGDKTHKVVMPKAATMTGRVTNSQGQPVEGAWVWTHGILEAPLEGVHSSQTDADGLYTLTDLEPFDVAKDRPIAVGNGTFMSMRGHYLRIRHPSYAQQVALFTKAPGSYDVVLTDGGTVEGQVIDAVTGKPAPNVGVTVRSIDKDRGDNWRETLTDEQGRYKVTGLGPANYSIWARAADRTCVALELVPVVANQTQQAPALQLILGGWLEGRVVQEGVQPMSHDPETGHRLRIGLHGPSYPKHAPGIDWCAVDDDGRFRIRVAPGRNFPSILSNANKIWSRTEHREEFEAGVEVQAGETHRLLFRVLPAEQPR